MNKQFDNKSSRWLITGGCGFIGTALIRNLMSEGGHFVRVLDNLSVGTKEDLATVCAFTETGPDCIEQPKEQPCSVELIEGDILDASVCFIAAQGMDVIVHLAANTGVGPSVKDPRKDMVTNVMGTFNMLEAARHNGIKRFVFASSGAPVGECEPPLHEEVAPHPVSPYGASKLAGEGYCSAYYRTFGLETVALRFGNVYGPGSVHKNSVVAKFIRRTINGETLEIYGDGSQSRDFIYIDDLVAALYKSATLGPLSLAGETFQIATHSETTVGELADVLGDILNSRGLGPVKIAHSEPRKGDVKRNYSDTTKSRKYLKWVAETRLKRGLEQTVDWFFANRTGNLSR